MTIIECVRDWLKTFPGLTGRLDVDFLGEDADTYSIDTIPSEAVIKRFKDGGTMRQFFFAVSSRRFYDQNIAQNIDNLKFFDDLGEWVEAKAKARQLPDLGSGKSSQRIVITSTAYPFIVTEDGKARYQIQMRLEYYKEA